jgi:hypothetical protein
MGFFSLNPHRGELFIRGTHFSDEETAEFRTTVTGSYVPIQTWLPHWKRAFQCLRVRLLSYFHTCCWPCFCLDSG